MKYILFSILLFALGACSSKTAEDMPQDTQEAPGNTVSLTEAQFRNAGIKTGRLKRQSISSILKANGYIDVPPQNMVSISVPLGGYLKSTRLLPGMPVHKGETIAMMEDPQYIQIQQDYLTAKVRLISLEAEYQRQKELNQTKASSDKVYQQALADYSSQKILLQSLSEKLKLIGIHPQALNENNISRSVAVPSPIDGYVTKVNVNIGRYVNPADVLFEIVNPSDIHLALTVFEKDINQLAIGQKLVAYTNTEPEKKYPCEIILIGKDFSDDRSVMVHCHFKQYDHSLIPGMFMNAEIEVNKENALALPTEAIVDFGNKHYVFAEQGQHRYAMMEVQTGNSENGYTEILPTQHSDLTDKSIVVKGAYTLLMKMKNTESED